MPHPKYFASASKGQARKKDIDATDTNVFFFAYVQFSAST